MLDSLKNGPLPLLYPCAMPGMVEAVQKAARMASASRTFDREAVGRVRGTGRTRHEWRIPAGSGVLYLEIWADDVMCRPHAIGVLFHRDSGDCAVSVGKGWPGDDPEVLPALLTISGGGQVEMKTPKSVRTAVERTARDLIADVLRALDAVAREEAGEDLPPEDGDFPVELDELADLLS
ncbi:hypothetical protein [Gluconobacter sp. P1C6_b]|uniref:hypothetical protein n=1 Tax=Gluconobacter sp. P1C6_b TaxID=2762619 RepID=UPI001C05595D|nr:hypothetical protein [Gluconobacter sp. P1C6_b]